MLDKLLAGVQQHDRRALSQLLSFLAQGESVEAIRSHLPAANPKARVIAITGGAGVGKSSFIGRLLPLLRAKAFKAKPRGPRRTQSPSSTLAA